MDDLQNIIEQECQKVIAGAMPALIAQTLRQYRQELLVSGMKEALEKLMNESGIVSMIIKNGIQELVAKELESKISITIKERV